MTQFRSHKAVQEYLANRGRITLLFSGVVLTVSVLLFFYIWQYTKMVEIQIAIAQVRRLHNKQNEQLEGMQVERAKLTAMARIEQLARVRLGMVPPSRENMQFLSAKGMVVAPKDRPIIAVPQRAADDDHVASEHEKKEKPKSEDREAAGDTPGEQQMNNEDGYQY